MDIGRICFIALVFDFLSGESMAIKSLLFLFLFWSFPCFATYQIGTGIDDITGPAAEVGMMGYAKFDQVANGIHTRLYSRAFIFLDSNTKKRIVFVSADLGFIFQSVKQGVLRELEKRYGDLYTDENVMLSATHTHSGPGGYAHDILFNITTYGFISENYHVIVNGIVESIVRAHSRLKPGQIFINRGDITTISRNRSPEAYANNPDDEKSKYSFPFNTHMTLLKLQNPEGEIGMLNWFALHGVSMSNRNKLISSDNKGIASYLFEKDMRTLDNLSQNKFVAAFAQSDEGDVTPHLLPPNIKKNSDEFEETYLSAYHQFEYAKSLYGIASEELEGEISYRHAYVDFANIMLQTTSNGMKKTGGAALGYSFAAGTEDGRGSDFFHEGTLVSNPFIDIVTSIVAIPSTELKTLQYPKPILLSTGTTIPRPWTTSVLPIQIFRIGKLLILGVPAEFTTMSGRRLRQTIKDVYGDEVKYIVIAGLSNSYSGYVTTQEEYNVQRYEGGFTLFGPQTLHAYQQEFKHLAEDLKFNKYTMQKFTPPDYSHDQITLQTGVVFDDVPLGHKFGDVITNPKNSYLSDDTVTVKFYGAHPKNNLRQNDTFLLVERKESNQWVKIADDANLSTIYHWRRSGASYSHVIISWKIPHGTKAGKYRIHHFGDYKNGWNGKIYPYEGVTKSFFVTN